jgi:hypothetical protein
VKVSNLQELYLSSNQLTGEQQLLETEQQAVLEVLYCKHVLPHLCLAWIWQSSSSKW